MEKRPIFDGSAGQQAVIDEFWNKTHDPQILYMIKGENGTIDPNRVSPINKNGYRDYGLCQINKGYHPEIVNNPKFKDWHWQVDRCIDLFYSGTTFYAYKRFQKDVKFRTNILKAFTWK